MSHTVISVEHLTKKYDLGVIGTGTLSRDLNRWWARLRKQPDPYTRIGQRDAFERIGESILALDDVSFTVEQGEALGIIGRNGAGKSTLLKILSRVTAPTSGVVKVKGRIGSLLEVGTGFHPELTGRENIYLNGAILGMKKAEVTRKFDEIVDFAGVEKFIDTPVKRYSSGMYVRLAFAVAAHLDPEILIVDEVLAVGDASFQKKCLGKMGEVTSEEGRTVLLVSHNMNSIKAISKSCLLLHAGILAENGETVEVTEHYLTDYSNHGEIIRQDSNFVKWLGIFDKTQLRNLKPNDNISINLGFYNNRIKERFYIDFAVVNEKDERVIHAKTKFLGKAFLAEENKQFEINLSVLSPRLSPGKYYLSIYLFDDHRKVHLWIEGIDAFTIQPISYFGISDIIDGFNSAIFPEYQIDLLQAPLGERPM